MDINGGMIHESSKNQNNIHTIKLPLIGE